MYVLRLTCNEDHNLCFVSQPSVVQRWTNTFPGFIFVWISQIALPIEEIAITA